MITTKSTTESTKDIITTSNLTNTDQSSKATTKRKATGDLTRVINYLKNYILVMLMIMLFGFSLCCCFCKDNERKKASRIVSSNSIYELPLSSMKQVSDILSEKSNVNTLSENLNVSTLSEKSE